ncbi:hypothetical protein EGW08_012316 [Elysia chlorotica]|uniref:Uncharacterized protein n=1 Tax=Elysia chlorotica TaxID=188477 RepID=A0A433TEE0_ELYCH|nr:hypothetical protein EGW08_012316 [Elysia chlorotica]
MTYEDMWKKLIIWLNIHLFRKLYRQTGSNSNATCFCLKLHLISTARVSHSLLVVRDIRHNSIDGGFVSAPLHIYRFPPVFPSFSFFFLLILRRRRRRRRRR